METERKHIVPWTRAAAHARLPTPRTPLHCAASCNDTAICTALVQHGAAIFATTLSDGATAIEKCDPYREGYADCATYLAGARRGEGPSARDTGQGKEADRGSPERMPGEVRGCTDL